MDENQGKLSGQNKVFFLILIAFAFVVGLATGQATGRDQGMEAVRNEAAKAGAAEWVPGANGEPMILWRKGK